MLSAARQQHDCPPHSAGRMPAVHASSLHARDLTIDSATARHARAAAIQRLAYYTGVRVAPESAAHQCRFVVGRDRRQLAAEWATAGDGEPCINPKCARLTASGPLLLISEHLSHVQRLRRASPRRTAVAPLQVRPALSRAQLRGLLSSPVSLPPARAGPPRVRCEPHDGQRRAARRRGPPRGVILQVPRGSVLFLRSGARQPGVTLAQRVWSPLFSKPAEPRILRAPNAMRLLIYMLWHSRLCVRLRNQQSPPALAVLPTHVPPLEPPEK